MIAVSWSHNQKAMGSYLPWRPNKVFFSSHFRFSTESEERFFFLIVQEGGNFLLIKHSLSFAKRFPIAAADDADCGNLISQIRSEL